MVLRGLTSWQHNQIWQYRERQHLSNQSFPLSRSNAKTSVCFLFQLLCCVVYRHEWLRNYATIKLTLEQGENSLRFAKCTNNCVKVREWPGKHPSGVSMYIIILAKPVLSSKAVQLNVQFEKSHKRYRYL